MKIIDLLGNPIVLIVAVVCFITSLTARLKKNEKLADSTLVVFWIIVLTQMLFMVVQLCEEMTSEGMGYPNVHLLFSMIGVCFYSFSLMLAGTVFDNLIDFNKAKLKRSATCILMYLVVVLMSGSILTFATYEPKNIENPSQSSEPTLTTPGDSVEG